jgi:Holliday junction resolvase-like predicted endonuclease
MAIAASLFLLVPLVARAETEERQLPREEILATIKRVGILPPIYEEPWPRSQAASAEFAQLATKWLQRAGMDVVGVAEYEAVVGRIKQELGGWYDPMTGVLNEAKREDALQRARGEYLTGQKLDGFVQLRFDVVAATMMQDKAYWHGTKEVVRLPTGRGKFAQMFADSVVTTSGKVPALSVAVLVLNREGKMVYGRYGPVQLLKMVRDVNTVEFVDIDPDFVLGDPVRNARAVRSALRPLAMSKDDIRKEDAEDRRQQAASKSRKDDPGGADAEGTAGESAAPVTARIAAPAPPALPPLRVPLQDLNSRVKVIALAPVTVNLSVEIPDPRAGVEEAMAGELAKHYRVVPSSAYADIRKKRFSEHGPYFDAYTRELLPAQRSALLNAIYGDLKLQYQSDAILFTGVVEAVAVQSNGQVVWDGVTQSFSQSENLFARMNAATTGTTSTVPAVSISARLVDGNQSELFVKRAGIQTLRRMGAVKEVDVAPETLLTDAERRKQAVAILLDELSSSP